MKPWHETIHLTAPVRDVRMAGEKESKRHTDEQLREAYQRGLRDGERRLGEQLIQQRADMLELQNGVINSLKQTFPKVIAECQDSMIILATQIAQKLVADMPIDANMIESVVKEALTHVEQTNQYQIQLNPVDLELLKKFNSQGPKQWTQNEGVELVASPEVTRGGCVIQTRFGLIDARRETKMDLIKDSMKGH